MPVDSFKWKHYEGEIILLGSVAKNPKIEAKF